MSWHVVAPVSRLHLEGTAKIVLVMLANESDDQGCSATAIETLGLKAGVSERTVKRMLEWYLGLEVLLEDDTVRGRGRARRLRIDLARAEALFGRNPSWAERRALRKKGDTMSPFHKPGKGDTLSIKGDTLSKKGDTVSPIPLKDPIENPRARDPADGGGDAPAANDKPADQGHAEAAPAAKADPWAGDFPGVKTFLVALGNGAEAAGIVKAYDAFIAERFDLGYPEARLVHWFVMREIHGEGRNGVPIKQRLFAKLRGAHAETLLLRAKAAAEQARHGGPG